PIVTYDYPVSPTRFALVSRTSAAEAAVQAVTAPQPAGRPATSETAANSSGPAAAPNAVPSWYRAPATPGRAGCAASTPMRSRAGHPHAPQKATTTPATVIAVRPEAIASVPRAQAASISAAGRNPSDSRRSA